MTRDAAAREAFPGTLTRLSVSAAAAPTQKTDATIHFFRYAGVNLVVVRSGRQNRREVELAVDRLTQAGAAPRGFVFNDLVAGSRRYAYAGYRCYRYEKQAT